MKLRRTPRENVNAVAAGPPDRHYVFLQATGNSLGRSVEILVDGKQGIWFQLAKYPAQLLFNPVHRVEEVAAF